MAQQKRGTICSLFHVHRFALQCRPQCTWLWDSGCPNRLQDDDNVLPPPPVQVVPHTALPFVSPLFFLESP